MRLKKGFFRVWLEDMDRLFSQSPKEFAMFYYLLSNCHYKDIPFETTVKGNTWKKEIYNQKWLIQKGDYFGSKKQLTSFWKFDYRTQKTIFSSMAKKGLIEILLEDPALIIRIKNYEIWAWRGKSKERPPFPLTTKPEPASENSEEQEEKEPPDGDSQTTEGGEENPVGGMVILPPKSSSSSLKESLKSSLIKGEGDETQPEETLIDQAISPPPLDNLIQLPLDGEKSEEDHLYEEADKIYSWLNETEFDSSVTEEEKKKALERWDWITARTKELSANKKATNLPPKPEESLSLVWSRYCSKSPTGSKASIQKYDEGIKEIIEATKSDLAYVERIYGHLISGRDRLVSEKFFFPWDSKTLWNKKIPNWTVLDETIKSMSASNRKRS